MRQGFNDAKLFHELTNNVRMSQMLPFIFPTSNASGLFCTQPRRNVGESRVKNLTVLRKTQGHISWEAYRNRRVVTGESMKPDDNSNVGRYNADLGLHSMLDPEFIWTRWSAGSFTNTEYSVQTVRTPCSLSASFTWIYITESRAHHEILINLT